MRAIRTILAVGGGVLLNSAIDSIKYKDPDWKWKLLAAGLCIGGAFFIAFVLEV